MFLPLKAMINATFLDHFFPCYAFIFPCCGHINVHFYNTTKEFTTLCDPMDWSLPGSSVHGIFQARVLEWVAISFSRGSSQPRARTRVSRSVGRHFTVWATREALKNLQVLLKLYTHQFSCSNGLIVWPLLNLLSLCSVGLAVTGKEAWCPPRRVGWAVTCRALLCRGADSRALTRV